MWDNNDFSMNAGKDGGFFESKTDTPGTGKKDEVKRAQSIMPVVIGMLQESKSEEFTMWGLPTHVLKIVGIVKKFDVSSTKATYEVVDHTGRIQAILWLEQDIGTQPNIPVNKENIYVRIFGTMRKQGNSKMIMILRIDPISSMNEITTHLLEVIHVRFRTEKMLHGENQAARFNNPGTDLTNTMMSFTSNTMGNSEEENMSPLQLKVYRFIKEFQSKVGASRTAIREEFPNVPVRDLNDALEFLSGEGHVFSTVDNDHFKHTD